MQLFECAHKCDQRFFRIAAIFTDAFHNVYLSKTTSNMSNIVKLHAEIADNLKAEQ